MAEGNVEALFADTRLTATRVVYDRAPGAMQITGPLVLSDGAGNRAAGRQVPSCATGLRLGLIRSARVVLDQQLQLAANTVERRSERFTEMNTVVASACEICPDTEHAPVGSARRPGGARCRGERQLYFDNARAFPAVRPAACLHPAPARSRPKPGRATGLLSPRFSLDTDHGFGLRAPYFIALSSDKDLTLTPFLGTKGTYALEARYRQAFSNGSLELGGLVARDSIRNGELRGMVYAEGDFTCRAGIALAST